MRHSAYTLGSTQLLNILVEHLAARQFHHFPQCLIQQFCLLLLLFLLLSFPALFLPQSNCPLLFLPLAPLTPTLNWQIPRAVGVPAIFRRVCSEPSQQKEKLEGDLGGVCGLTRCVCEGERESVCVCVCVYVFV